MIAITLRVAFNENQWRYESYHAVFDQGRYQQGNCWKFTLPCSERRKV